MPIPLPPLPSLRLFEAAARHESFRKAAEELGLTASAVSHGIDSLEKWLGVELFRRRPRGVTLTQAGRHLLPYVAEGLSMIALGAQRLPGRRAERRVVLSVAPTFAQLFLVPRLPRFRALHPGIRISIDTSHRQALFPMEGVDLSIRMGKGAWPGVKSDLMFRDRLVPVASPAYLASTSRDGTIDWRKATYLRVTTFEYDWTAWIEGAAADIEVVDDLHDAGERGCRGGTGNCYRADSAGRSRLERGPAGQGRRQDRRYRHRLLAGRPVRPGNPLSHSIVPQVAARRSQAIPGGTWFALIDVNRFHPRAGTIHLS
jgi:DNA-binding transcriptional LysR family regulator